MDDASAVDGEMDGVVVDTPAHGQSNVRAEFLYKNTSCFSRFYSFNVGIPRGRYATVPTFIQNCESPMPLLTLHCTMLSQVQYVFVVV